MADLLVSRSFINAFVRDHAWHSYVIPGKTHWLKTFLFRLMGRRLTRKISLYSPKNTPSCLIRIEASCFVLFSVVNVYAFFFHNI